MTSAGPLQRTGGRLNLIRESAQAKTSKATPRTADPQPETGRVEAGLLQSSHVHVRDYEAASRVPEIVRGPGTVRYICPSRARFWTHIIQNR